MTDYPFYIPTDDGHARRVTREEFDRWTEANPTGRRIAMTYLPDGRWISTVFMALDHAYDGGDPVLWETMIFPKESYVDLYCTRYISRAEALEGHAIALRWALAHPEAA